MYKVYLKVPSACNESKYKTYRNKLNHILKKAQKQHYTDLLAANKNTIKKFANHENEKNEKKKWKKFTQNSNLMMDP